MPLDRSSLDRFATRQRGPFEDLLRQFVEVPSVSADPERRKDLERVAELGVETIRRFGGQADLHRVPGGSPMVLGRFDSAPGDPTVTVYNHLDVQPASRETEPWRTEPFVFTKDGDTYYGRGATDDKGPALTALLGAQAAREAGVRVNIRFLWETEEEIGVKTLAAMLAVSA